MVDYRNYLKVKHFRTAGNLTHSRQTNAQPATGTETQAGKGYATHQGTNGTRERARAKPTIRALTEPKSEQEPCRTPKRGTQERARAMPSTGALTEPLSEQGLCHTPKRGTQKRARAMPFTGALTEPKSKQGLCHTPKANY